MGKRSAPHPVDNSMSTAKITKPSKKKTILVLGGNGMMGLETVLKLHGHGHGDHHIITVSRGRNHWNSADILKDKVHQVICDRDKLTCKKDPQSWPDELQDPALYFDFVIDFSSYTRKDIRSALELCNNRVGTYIYISSDSVYEVSDTLGPRHIKGITCSVESDACRPSSKELYRRLRRSDRYGHGKFAGEEELSAYVKEQPNSACIFLRLADVVGVRDHTDRWAKYVVWIFACWEWGCRVELPDCRSEQQLSFVHSVDVANLISKIVGFSIQNHALGRAYNLAFNQPITLRGLLEVMGRALGTEKLKFKLVPEEEATTFFPSVERGPVDVTLASEVLGWSPPILEDVMPRICLFYVEALLGRHPDAMEALQDFIDDDGILDKYIDSSNLKPGKIVDLLTPRLKACLARYTGCT